MDNLTVLDSGLEKLAEGFEFTEGPAADVDGNIFFTDQPNDRILKWSVVGQVSTFLQPSGRANGLYLDHQGNLIACADEKNELWSIGQNGQITVLVKDYQGKLLNGPNDLWVRPDDGIYFTDPYYPRNYWARGPMEQDGQHVYYLAPDRTTITRVIDDLEKPNGIIGTPDGKTLYIADIDANKTYAYDIQPDGSLTNKRLFCALGSDGMTLDDTGNVYLTGNGVTVFDQFGQQIGHIDISEEWTANATFGGLNRHLLFIAAGKSVYGLKMRIWGEFRRDGGSVSMNRAITTLPGLLRNIVENNDDRSIDPARRTRYKFRSSEAVSRAVENGTIPERRGRSVDRPHHCPRADLQTYQSQN